VDLDDDGFGDVMSGSHAGEIYLFRGRRGGKFTPGQQITNRHGNPISADYSSAVHAADWDADGDFDLLVGSGGGEVYLVPNEGSSKQYRFGKAEKLSVGGEPIQVPGGNSAPAAADWDADGRSDLLVGAEDGSVLWYRNLGTSTEPKLAAAKTIVPVPKEETERGIRAKICVTDWNEDGHLDLLVGDLGKEFDKELSDEEKRWREEALRQKADLLTVWASLFRQYRQLLQAPQPEQAKLREERQRELQSLREELQRVKRARDKARHQEQALEPGKQYHGRVWLFLRAKP
jgi:hypothetical protein